MIIIDIIVMGFIILGSAMINIWFVSQIVCSILYGIPQLLKLKRKGFLNKKASVFSYIFTILFNSLLCFGLYKLLEGNISTEWLFAYEIGLFISVVFSLSKRNKKFTYQDIMYSQRYNHGEIINELFDLSDSISNDVLNIINNYNIFYLEDVYSLNTKFFVNITMLNCFYLCLNFCMNHNIVETDDDAKYIISALLIKLSEANSSDYDFLSNCFYEIINTNQRFIEKEINEDMRIDYVLNYIISMLPSGRQDIINQEDEIVSSYIDISNMFFSIILGENVAKCDNMGMTLTKTSSDLKNALKMKAKSHKENKKIKKEKIIVVKEEDDFFKEEFEFSYAKVKKVLKKIGFDNYATFKKHVYDLKNIKRKKFDNKEEEINYLVQAVGYENFEDFYNTNMDID